jgi:quercetin dioxygenase-like cupin family protein
MPDKAIQPMAGIWNIFRRERVPSPVAGRPASTAKTTEPAAGACLPRLTSRIYPLQIPLPSGDEKGWKPHFIFSGCTADIPSLTCHVSALTQHQCPHPPHAHDEEELLLLLEGEVDILLPNGQLSKAEQRKRLRPGQFVYYPAHFLHTLETVSEHPANYLMFKWRTDGAQTGSPLAFGQFDLSGPVASTAVENGLSARVLFEGPTACLDKLHCHASTLTPGAGYNPHSDAYDVAIIVLDGEVETLGQCVGPYGVIFYPAGEPHGMRNPGKMIARYVVFEFHGREEGVRS